MNPSTAVTLSLQVALAALTLAFGVAGLRVARRAGAAERGWLMTGVTFVGVGTHALAHNILAVAAVAAGEESALYLEYVPRSAALNYARGITVIAYAAVLGAAVWLRRPLPRRIAPVAVGVALSLAAGTVMAVWEVPFVEAYVYPVLASLEAVAVVLLFLALYRALTANAFDYLLWTAVALYAVREAAFANLFSWFSYLGFPEVWKPSVRVLLMVGIVSMALMIGCSLRRLRMARQGQAAPTLLERLRKA